MFSMRKGRYIGISTSRVTDVTLGRLFLTANAIATGETNHYAVSANFGSSSGGKSVLTSHVKYPIAVMVLIAQILGGQFSVDRGRRE